MTGLRVCCRHRNAQEQDGQTLAHAVAVKHMVFVYRGRRPHFAVAAAVYLMHL